jgi:hypothetical protein
MSDCPVRTKGITAVDAPRYVPNTVIRRDRQTPTVKEEIRRYSSQYSARLSAHPNGLVVNLNELPDNKSPAKRSAYQIVSVIVVFVVLVCKVFFKFYSQKPQEALNY